MICLDTNIIIYLAKGVLSASVIGSESVALASVSRIEALGYHAITVAEERALRRVLAEIIELPLSEEVVERAIELRQSGRFSLGDAIVAATVLEYDLELWTANEADFRALDGLRLRNPLKG